MKINPSNTFNPAVRVAATGVCLAALNIDRDKAVSWYVNACSHNDDRVLACHNSRRFLAYAVHTHFTNVEPILVRMVKSELAEVRKWGAVHTTACWFIHDRLLVQFEECLRGTDDHRTGVAMAVSELTCRDELTESCSPIFLSLCADACPDVRRECNRAFHMHDLPEAADGNAFLQEYVSTKAFHDDPTPLLHALEHHIGPFLPLGEVVLAVCDVFSGPLADSSRDISTSVAGDAMHVAPLLLRLYEQAQGSGRDDVQDRCLDAWDRLLESRVGDVAKLMETIGQ